MRSSILFSLSLMAAVAMPAAAQTAARSAAGASVAVMLRQELDKTSATTFQVMIESTEKLGLSLSVADSIAMLNTSYLRYADSVFAADPTLRYGAMSAKDMSSFMQHLSAAHTKALVRFTQLTTVAKALLTPAQITTLGCLIEER